MKLKKLPGFAAQRILDSRLKGLQVILLLVKKKNSLKYFDQGSHTGNLHLAISIYNITWLSL